MSSLATWGVAGALLVAEYLLISFRFDAATVVQRGGLWTFVGSVGTVAPLAVVAATAVLVLGGARPAPGSAATAPRRKLRYGLLAVHAVLYGAFVAITSLVFGADAAPPGPPALWLGVWASAGGSSAIALLLGIVGPGKLRSVASTSLVVALGVGFAAWLAGMATTALWQPLTHATLMLVVALLRPWFPEVTVVPDDAVVALRDFTVIIEPACSGLEGIGLVLVLMLGLLVAFRAELRFPHALLLPPLGVLGVWLANGARLALLIAIGAYWDPHVALGGFHSKAGWVFFCAIALGLAVLARRSKYFARRPEAVDAPTENPTAAYLMPVLVVIATGLVTGMLTSGVDELYGLRLLTAATALFAYRRYYAELERRIHPASLAVGAAVGALWIVTAVPPAVEPEPVGSLWLAARIAGAVLLAPVCEELAFRGYALRRLVALDFSSVSFRAWSPLAVLGSSLAFAALHERWMAAFLTGIVYAAVQIRSGRLLDAIAAHASSNAVICAWVLFTGERFHL